MPRIRSLKPDMWQDEDLGTVSIEAQALFIGLITQADDEGRLKGSAARMRALIWPYKTGLDVDQIDGWLDELQNADLVVRYESDERQYLALPGWTKHQRIDKPSDSEFPAPHGPDSRTVASGSESSRTLPLDRSKERKGKEEGSSLRSDPVAPKRDDAAARNGIVRELFDLWRERCGHEQAKLTRDRRRKLEARLKEGYTPEQIRVAIEGAAKAPYIGDNGVRYDDLELICRNGSKLDLFIQRAGQDDDSTTEALVSGVKR